MIGYGTHVHEVRGCVRVVGRARARARASTVLC